MGVDPVWEIDSFQPPRPLSFVFPNTTTRRWKDYLMARISPNTDKASTRRRRGLPISVADLPKSLQKVNLNAAGIDIGATQHYAAVPEGRDEVTVRCFGTFTADLHALADWLERCGIKTVAMESTGVYWIPVFELLEERGLEVKLVEPGRLKSVPGRKTDVLDCQWIQQLHTYGLLQGSFRPEEEICVLRSYMRQRAMLVKYAGQHVQHMQKALMQMNVQLHHVITDISGATGLRIIDAILTGQHDPHELATLRDERCKRNEEEIALALQGNWREEHLFALKQALELYRFYHQQLSELDERIEACLKTFEDRSADQKVPPPRRPKAGSNAPEFDVRKLLLQMTGVDLTTVDGLNGYSALELISEIGTDMACWPTEKHFASWLCLCPGNKKTGGRSVSGKTRRSANRAAATLRMAAQSLARADCALGAYYRRMRARLGGPKAITATAHKLAKIVYNMLRYGKPYVDVGADYYERQYRQRVLKNLARRAAQFGLSLTPAVDGSTDQAMSG
jgi:transposase